MTHVSVAFKIKSGGQALQAGGLAVNFTERSVVLENSENGEILSHIELGNAIDPFLSSWTCSATRIDIKLKKATDDMQWKGLEQGAGGVQAVPA